MLPLFLFPVTAWWLVLWPACYSMVVQLEVLQNQSEGGPWSGQVEKVVSRLQNAGQVTPQGFDDILCYTPKGKRKPVAISENRMTSRRMLRPLRSTLLSE